MRALLLCLVVVLAACTTHWSRRGTSPQEFERDQRECDAQARLFGYVYIESRYRDCMVGRGYHAQ